MSGLTWSAEVSSRIRRALWSAGLDEGALRVICGVSARRAGRLWRGALSYTVDEVVAVARALGREPSSLVSTPDGD